MNIFGNFTMKFLKSYPFTMKLVDSDLVHSNPETNGKGKSLTLDIQVCLWKFVRFQRIQLVITVSASYFT